MVNKIKAGLLLLYIKLYDDARPSYRDRMMPHVNDCVSKLRDKGMDVTVSDVCRTEDEFDAAIDEFIKNDIDVLITLHMAYSPSLESIGALKRVDVPIVVLDSTPCYDFKGQMYDQDEITPNHGIHGVQDMCNLLKRNNRVYTVEAGHLYTSDVIDRVYADCRAAKAAKILKHSKIGAVGGVFKGMGDFYKTPEEIRNEIGAEVIDLDMSVYHKYYDSVTPEELDADCTFDYDNFEVTDINKENQRIANRTGLAIKKWIYDEGITSFTVNFFGTGTNWIHKMPFSSICKIIMGGIGYAGEGDTLTAGLVGALQNVYPETTFTEMFCPCWKTEEIFLSHMGEMNMNIANAKPRLINNSFPWTDAGDTVQLNACFKAGDAVLVNLAPMNKGYSLIVTPVNVFVPDDTNSVYKDEVRGWIKPCMPLAPFLEAYSNNGGTHHSALVYGVSYKEIAKFGRYMDFNVVEIV